MFTKHSQSQEHRGGNTASQKSTEGGISTGWTTQQFYFAIDLAYRLGLLAIGEKL